MLQSIHFRELGFFRILHHVFTNKFQLITMIEKYIASHHCTSQKVLIDVRVRPYGVGDKNRVTSNVLIVTCANDDVKVVTTALGEMTTKKLLPGHAAFCSLNIYGFGVEEYKKLLNGNNHYINNTKNLAMINVNTIDFEKVLQATSGGIKVCVKYITPDSNFIEPSNIKGKFHFLSQNQQLLDEFTDDVVFPLLMAFQPCEIPKIINRYLRKEDLGIDKNYMQILIHNTPSFENNVVLKSFSTPTRSCASATSQQQSQKVRTQQTNRISAPPTRARTQRAQEVPKTRSSNNTFDQNQIPDVCKFPAYHSNVMTQYPPLPQTPVTPSPPTTMNEVSSIPTPIMSSTQPMNTTVTPPRTDAKQKTEKEMKSFIQQQINRSINTLNNKWESKLQNTLQQFEQNFQTHFNRRFMTHERKFEKLIIDLMNAGFSNFYDQLNPAIQSFFQRPNFNVNNISPTNVSLQQTQSIQHPPTEGTVESSPAIHKSVAAPHPEELQQVSVPTVSPVEHQESKAESLDEVLVTTLILEDSTMKQEMTVTEEFRKELEVIYQHLNEPQHCNTIISQQPPASEPVRVSPGMMKRTKAREAQCQDMTIIDVEMLEQEINKQRDV